MHAVSSSRAAADHAATPPKSRTRSDQFVEEITVTAEKTDKSIQDSGLSIQAFDVNAMEKMGINRLQDLGSFTPGMTFSPSSNGSGMMAMTSRGIGERDYHPNRASKVGLYIDGNYIGVGAASNLDLLDIERIEVLKGPQGTLFGRNTIGGAVSVISKHPEPGFGGEVRGTAGMHDERSLRVSLNVPLIDERLFSRIAVVRKLREPFFENSFSGAPDYNDADEFGARFALRWLPTDRLLVDWSLEYVQHDQDPVANNLMGHSTSGPFAALAPYVRRDMGNIRTDGRRFFDLDLWQSTATITWDVSESMSVKSISGWRSLDHRELSDADGTPLNLFHQRAWFDHETFYQELQVVGAVADGRLDYAVGANWFEESSDSYLQRQTFQQFYGGILNNTGDAEANNHALGLYGQVTAHLTERVHATAGVRFSKERRAQESSLCSRNPLLRHPASCPNPPSSTNFLGVETTYRSDNWSPMMRLAYDWTDDLMTYVSWTRGYGSGGINPRFGALQDLNPYKDEIVAQWEAGIKSQWFNNRLRVNASGYYSDYSEMQTSVYDGLTRKFINAGRARMRGWEIDISAVPMKGLRVGLSHAWNRGDFSEYMECPPGAPAGCTPINRARFYRMAVNPKRTYSGFASYTFDPLEFGTLEISANFHRQSPTGYLFGISQFNNTKGHRYTVYGARIGLYDAFAISGLSVAVVGTNLTDRSYAAYGVDYSTFHTNVFGDPRHVILEVGYAF